MKNKLLTILKSKLFIYSFIIVLFFVATQFPDLIEKYYSNFIYFYISNLLRIIFGIFGFSIGDVLFFIVILYLILNVYKYIKNQKKNFKNDSLKFIEKLMLLFIIFQLVWGFNYYRIPLHKKMDLKRDYSQEELLIFTEKLIKHTNKIHKRITKNKDSVLINYTLQTNMYRNAVNDYKNIYEKFPQFYFKNQSSKSSLWSLWLSLTGFGGYYNQFTGEVQINTLQPNYDMPTLLCHEMAHQIGYASESEANFIAVLITLKSDNLLSNYSGSAYLLKYCLHNLNQENKEKCLEKINNGVKKNYEQDKKHHEKYASFLEPIMKNIYKNFLVFNNQKDGLEEYNKFLGMIISLNEKENILIKMK